MATTQTLLNQVLRGLRQFALLIDSATTTITDDYLLLILQFLNEAKAEVEENGWAWQALRQNVVITLSAATSEYTLTTSGAADVDTNDRTRLLYFRADYSEGFRVGSASLPQMFDVTNTPTRLRQIAQEEMAHMHMTDSAETGPPVYFALWHSSDAVKFQVWPTPAQTYTLNARFYIPQADLESTAIDTTELTIPSRPVYTLALWKANQERGTELGKEDSSLHITFKDSLGAAVAAEMSPSDETVYLDR